MNDYQVLVEVAGIPVTQLANSNQLPRTLFPPYPNETPEQAVARARKALGHDPAIFQIKKLLFLADPEEIHGPVPRV